jgi:lipopolysaccharide/colanic/teichoic acid biosynthesis glycosyltransferase
MRNNGLLSRLYVQMIIVAIVQAVLVLVSLLPIYYYTTLLSNDGLNHRSIWILFQTIILCGIAASISISIEKQLSDFPGRNIENLLPGLLLGYLVVAAAAFAARFDYSRAVFLTSMSATLLYLLLDYHFRARHILPHIGVVAEGQLHDITSLDGATFELLQTPSSETKSFDMIIADLNSDLSVEWQEFIVTTVLSGVPLKEVKHAKEYLTGRVEVDHLSESAFSGLLHGGHYMKIKRFLDVVTALLLMPIVLPIILFFALLIRLESTGPAIYMQQRAGKRAQSFTMYKLRSMLVQAERGGLFTQAGDSRVTRIGKFIRKYRIDELPQIFNIIKGDMSWIGPRPEPVPMVQEYCKTIPFYLYRQTAFPGITGWAQVNQGYVADFDGIKKKLQYDFYYIKYYSASLDLLIMVKTASTILTGFRAQ